MGKSGKTTTGDRDGQAQRRRDSEGVMLGTQPLLAATEDHLYGYAELHSRTGIKPSTAASLVFRKQIPHIRLGKRLVRFSRDAIERWIAERTVSVAA